MAALAVEMAYNVYDSCKRFAFAADIALFFRDLSPFIESCRYNECTHDHEPDCAVKAAVDEGRVDHRRYESYLRIIEGMEED